MYHVSIVSDFSSLSFDVGFHCLLQLRPSWAHLSFPGFAFVVSSSFSLPSDTRFPPFETFAIT